jgi:hypothetical protein
MNCSLCKNPIAPTTSICEWCGSTILKSNDSDLLYTFNQEIEIFVRFAGAFLHVGDAIVFVDGVEAGIGSCRNGFEFRVLTNNIRPSLEIHCPYNGRVYKRQILFSEEFSLKHGGSYMIELEATHLHASGFSTKPKKITSLKIN